MLDDVAKSPRPLGATQGGASTLLSVATAGPSLRPGARVYCAGSRSWTALGSGTGSTKLVVAIADTTTGVVDLADDVKQLAKFSVLLEYGVEIPRVLPVVVRPGTHVEVLPVACQYPRAPTQSISSSDTVQKDAWALGYQQS